MDRKVLKTIALSERLETEVQEQEKPGNEIEASLLEAARRSLSLTTIPFDADFFVDLGGHSLLAARFVSIVRDTPSLASITLQDLYTCRTLRNLSASHLGKQPIVQKKCLPFEPPPFRRRFLCALGQFFCLPLILSISAAQWLAIFISYIFVTPVDASFVDEATTLFGIIVSITLITAIISIAGKWLVIGRTRPGRYPLWGFYYFRWWLSQRLLSLTNGKLLQSSPLMPLYLKALGAKIGRDVQISDIEIGAVDLVSIGSNASLGAKLKFQTLELREMNWLLEPSR